MSAATDIHDIYTTTMTTLLLKNVRSKIELNQSSLNIVQYCTTYLNLFCAAVASGSSFTQKYYSFRRYGRALPAARRRPRIIIIIIYYYNYSDQAVHVLVS